MPEQFQRLIRFQRLLFKFKNIKLAIILSRYPAGNYARFLNQISFRNGELFFQPLALAIPVDTIATFSADFELLTRIAKFASVSVVDNKLIITVPFNGEHIRFRIGTHDSISTVEDVFSAGLYSYDVPDDEAYAVIDIGMNVAIASLYFASFSSVKKVFAYEPFKPTYIVACENIGLNANLSSKIKAFNYGIGAVNKTLELPAANAGDAGFSTTVESTSTAGKALALVDIKSIDDVMRDIETHIQHEKLYLKLDCEGAEYEIIQSLNTSGKLNNIEVVELEWHYKGAEQLIDVLKVNNFKILYSNTNVNGFTGTIKAIK